MEWLFKKFGKNSPRRINTNSGFTLIEIMIVLAIVGMLFSFVGVNIMNKYKESQLTSAKIQLTNYEQVLQAYYLDNNRYPSTAQGLEALISKPGVGKIPKWVNGPYFAKKELVKDPWGNDFVYVCDNYQDYTLASAGPDGEEGTDDDITSDE